MSQLTPAVGPYVTPSWFKGNMQLPFTVYDTGRDEPYVVKPGALRGWKPDDVPDDAFLDPGYRQLIATRMWYHTQPWYVRLWLRTKLLFGKITPQSIGRLACTKQQLEDYLDMTQGQRAQAKDFSRMVLQAAQQVKEQKKVGSYAMRPGLDVKATDIAQLEWELVLDNMKAFLEANGRAPAHLHMTTLMTERIALRCIHNRTIEPTEDIRVKFKNKLLGCVPHYDAPEFKLE